MGESPHIIIMTNTKLCVCGGVVFGGVTAFFWTATKAIASCLHYVHTRYRMRTFPINRISAGGATYFLKIARDRNVNNVSYLALCSK